MTTEAADWSEPEKVPEETQVIENMVPRYHEYEAAWHLDIYSCTTRVAIEKLRFNAALDREGRVDLARELWRLSMKKQGSP